MVVAVTPWPLPPAPPASDDPPAPRVNCPLAVLLPPVPEPGPVPPPTAVPPGPADVPGAAGPPTPKLSDPSVDSLLAPLTVVPHPAISAQPNASATRCRRRIMRADLRAPRAGTASACLARARRRPR